MESEVATWEEKCLDRSFVLKRQFRRFAQGLGSMHGRNALCIGPLASPLRNRLQGLGGMWIFVDNLSDSAPYEDGQFDRLLIFESLERVEDDYVFIATCHRLLKPSGLLLIDTEHAKRWTVWRPVRRWFGIDSNPALRVRFGYTEAALFALLKDGFDVQQTKSYSRFGVEAVETVARLMIGAWLVDEDPEEEARVAMLRRLYWVQTIFYPFFVVAQVLDLLIFFTRGYRLFAVTRRRLWKPRLTPVLRDGRSLADATLNSKIGTATLF